MKERIYGTECEYALCYQSEDKETMSQLAGEDLLEYQKGLTTYLLCSLRDKGCPLAGEFLGNGGRFYMDRGGHPEYATPECRSVRDLVAHEKAGDRIVQELVEVARLLMVQQGGSRSLHIFKNNVDLYGNTYGGHENYLVTPWAMKQIRKIIPFLVTRQIFTGAGKVMTRWDPGDVLYQLSQRADFIDRVFTDRTSKERGIINTRKREIPREGQNIRFHIILGDCNMSEYAIGLKIGTTGLVLRLLEAGALNGIPGLSSPVQALKSISRSFNGPLRVEERKQRYTALEIQSMYLEKVQRFFSAHQASGEEDEILQLWASTLEKLKKLKLSSKTWELEEDPKDLKRRIDWILKLWILNRFIKKNGIDWGDMRLKSLDLKYHDLDPETGLFERCQALDLVDRMLDEEEIRRAQSAPPRGTRAWTRGMIIRNTMDKNVEVRIEDWEKINIRGQRHPGNIHFFDRHRRMVNALGIKLEDPFEADNLSVLKKVEHFVEIWS